MKLVVTIVCLLACSFAHAQNRGRRSILPDGTSVETKSFVSEKRFEKRYFDEKDNLLKIAIFNTNDFGLPLKGAFYDPKGKLRYWHRYVYSDDGKIPLETRVYNPQSELLLKAIFEKGKLSKVVDPSGRPLSQAGWKEYL